MEAEVVEVRINGEPRRIPPSQSVAALLAWLEIPADRVAVELNQAVVRKRDWETTPVPHGSQVEIVQFVGGG
jgi:thiamine biosynthesis protein ThiS